jgi:hypothetical protein
MITLTPAYGRDYPSKQAVINDLLAGKDFIFNDYSSRWNGKPVNLPQLLETGTTSVIARYKDNRQVANLDLTKLKLKLKPVINK